jgi:hypothetical protein
VAAALLQAKRGRRPLPREETFDEPEPATAAEKQQLDVQVGGGQLPR